jgi:hypothetical protein
MTFVRGAAGLFSLPGRSERYSMPPGAAKSSQ